ALAAQVTTISERLAYVTQERDQAEREVSDRREALTIADLNITNLAAWLEQKDALCHAYKELSEARFALRYTEQPPTDKAHVEAALKRVGDAIIHIKTLKS